MAILIDEKKRVLVQGITGREGRARTRLMREYGTNVVGGVTPGKGGQNVLGVPVFNTPQEAVNSLARSSHCISKTPCSSSTAPVTADSTTWAQCRSSCGRPLRKQKIQAQGNLILEDLRLQTWDSSVSRITSARSALN